MSMSSMTMFNNLYNNIGQFLTAPNTITSYLNNNVQFSCGVQAPWILKWEVDGIEARFLGSRGITFNTFTTQEDQTSTLDVMASLFNNNSEISCLVISIHDHHEIVDQATAFLFVQGSYNVYYIMHILKSISYDG